MALLMDYHDTLHMLHGVIGIVSACLEYNIQMQDLKEIGEEDLKQDRLSERGIIR